MVPRMMTQTLKTIETDVAIIGAGPSGLFMVFEAGFLGYKCVLMDALPEIGGQLTALYPEKPIYDIPGYPSILAGELVSKLIEQAAPFSPTYLLNEPAQSLNGEAGNFTIEGPHHTVKAKTVVIAGGAGMFSPRKPTQLTDLETFEEAGAVVYAISHKADYAGQDIVVAGGGDSAIDWVVELAGFANHVHVVHRRAEFRASEETVRQMNTLVEAGKVTIHTPTQLSALNGQNGQLESVAIEDLDGNKTTINATKLVCCFGLIPNPGSLEQWGLNVTRGKVPVTSATMESVRPGVLCIGDMATYDGKLGLILTAFAEAAIAAKQIQSIINPEKKFRLQFSTSKGAPTGF